MTPMDWIKIVGPLAGVVGAIFTTYKGIVFVKEHRAQPQVKLSNGFVTYGPHLSEPKLLLEAATASTKHVTLVGHGLMLPDGFQAVDPYAESSTSLPHELTPKHNCIVGYDLKGTARALRDRGYSGHVSLTGYFSDQLGRRHHSNSFAVDVDEWAKH